MQELCSCGRLHKACLSAGKASTALLIPPPGAGSIRPPFESGADGACLGTKKSESTDSSGARDQLRDGSDTDALRAQKKTDANISLFLCPEQDSNLHALNRHYPLKVACLPISPSGLFLGFGLQIYIVFFKMKHFLKIFLNLRQF